MILACSQGADVPAWAELIAEIHKVIASTVIKTLRQSGAISCQPADDLIQDAYVRILEQQALQTFRSAQPDSIYGYIKAIAYSAVQDYLRGQSAQKRGGGISHVNLNECSEDSLSAPAIELSILIREIDELLLEVTPLQRDRTIFLLHWKRGMSAKEISELPGMELTAKGVGSVLTRVQADLKRRIVSTEIAKEKGSKPKTSS